jgi:hypothetical protein
LKRCDVTSASCDLTSMIRDLAIDRCHVSACRRRLAIRCCDLTTVTCDVAGDMCNLGPIRNSVCEAILWTYPKFCV